MNLKKFRSTSYYPSHCVSIFSMFLLVNHIGLLLWHILDSNHCTWRSPHSNKALRRASVAPVICQMPISTSLSQDPPVQPPLPAHQSFNHDQSSFRVHTRNHESLQKCSSRNHCWPRVSMKACPSTKSHCHQSQPSDQHRRSSY
jgi:hypothetical protein